MDFIPVEIATQIVLENTLSFGEESIPFEKSNGRVLAENITADRPFPPFDRVTMDGVAIQGIAYENGQRSFPIENIQYAGEIQKTLVNSKACIEIMTGASLPKNADTVTRYEDLKIENGVAILNENLELFKNIHKKGYDRANGEILLSTGHLLKSADLAVLASIGKTIVKVKSRPKIALITTGDELVEVSELPLPHQIRKSNIYTISSLLSPYCSEIDQFHLKDDLSESIAALRTIFTEYHAVVLSGGVSAGKKDYLPEALQSVGVERIFHKIQQRPGKPMWFGRKDDIVVFALPGNPVSSFMCAIRYVLPWLKKSVGLVITEEKAVLEEKVIFKPQLAYFMQVKLHQQNGLLKATPKEGGGSGDLANLSLADAFMELPNNETSEFSKGNIYPIWRF